MLELYYAPDTCALATLIALEEAGIRYRLNRIDFDKNQQQGADYLAVNPKGRVPALVTESGIITETPAMLAFIAQAYPVARLAPVTDAYAFAQVQAFNSYLCSTLHVAHAHRMRGHRWVDPENTEAITAMQRKVPQSVGDCYAYIEAHAFQGLFVMGAAHTICDPYLFTLAQWMEGDGVDPQQFPKVAQHRAMMGERPAVQAALAAEASSG